jgi:transposase
VSSASPPESKAKLSADDLATLVATLQSEMLGIKSRLSEREVQVDSLQETIVNLAHENELLKRRIYGNRTEKLRTSENQLALGNLLDDEKQLQAQLAEAVAEAKPEPETSASPPATAPKAKPKGRRDLAACNLPKVLLEILDEDLEKTAKRIGWDVSHQLLFRRGGFSVLVKRVAKYEVPGKDGPTIVGVPQPQTLFPRGLLHSSVVAYILVQKFGLGVPHYRLEQHLEDQGLSLDRGMMSRYSDDAGGALGASIVHAMWQDAVATAAVISTDATGGMIQPEKRLDGQRQSCKKGHFFTAVVDCDHVLFAYTEHHTQEAVRKLFGSFKGYLQSDASNVYDILERGPPKDEDTDDGIKLVGCWAHCRRYFFEAAICKYPVGVQGLLRIRAIYAADDHLRKLPPAKRKLARDEHVRPLIDSFLEWAQQARFEQKGRNLATKALGYANNQAQELRRVLADGRLPLDNTRAERSLRKVVVGRKNWMFYGSDSHAESAAAIFSLVASCRLHSIDPQQYLDEIMRVLPYWPKHRYLELAPKYWQATRENLNPVELEADLCSFTVPPAALNFAR